MVITRHIDWLSITYSQDANLNDLFPMLQWQYTGEGRYGYRQAYRDSVTGAVYMAGSSREDMGPHLTLSGDTLNLFRADLGATDDGLCKTITKHGGRSSRIDLTINIHQGNLTPRSVYDAWTAGDLTARTKTARFIEGYSNGIEGDTFYLGSPRSDRLFRAYNKSVEQNIVDGDAWLRLELELRNLRASGALGSCASNGVSETVGGHMDDFINWHDPEFKQAVAGPAAPPYELPRKDTNRQRWLLGQVVKALASEIKADLQFRSRFDLALAEGLGPDYLA